MRDPEKQKELDNMTEDYRYRKTLLTSYRERWTLIKVLEWWKRYLTENEYPHQDRWEQYILWCTSKTPKYISTTVMEFLHQKSEEWFHRIIHSVANRSVRWRFHIHIYKEL